jgi:hypothetical protein
MKHINSEQELREANKLVNKIPKFSGQKEEIQFDEFVRQIETYADSMGWIEDDQGENEDICLLFRRNLKGQAKQMWRSMEEKNLINLYLWKDVKRRFQEQFPIKFRNVEQNKSEEKQCQAFNLVNKIPKFSGQKEEIQFEEFVRQIEAYADFVGWTNDEQGENEDICFLFRTKLDGQAD